MCNYALRLFPVVLLCGLALTVNAQEHRSTISGTISSPSGGVLANTNIQLTNLDTKQTMDATSDASGKYQFNDLAAGRYHLAARSGANWATPTPEIPVGANEAVRVDLTVGSGATTATAPVNSPVTSAEITPATDLASPLIETGFNTRDIQYLPSPAFIGHNGEQYGAYNLSLFPPGVGSNSGIGPGRGPVVGGVRPTGNNFYVEGLDNNNRVNPGPLAAVSFEATQEFNTQQNQFQPEYGHAAGGQFNNIIKTGNNGFHGALYEYFWNRNLNAVDQSYARAEILSNPRYDQNRLGGNLGFPIIHNKLFFFGDFEYIPLGFNTLPSSAFFAPTAAGYATLAGMNGVSAANLSLLRGILPAAPAGSSFVTVNGTQIPVGATPLLGHGYQNQYNGVGALDWNAGTNDKLQARYVQQEVHANFNGAQLPAFLAPLQTRGLIGSLAETHNFGGFAINELRLSYNRFANNITPSSVTFPGLTAFPNIGIQDLGLTLGQGFFGAELARLNTYSVADNVHWTAGRHTFRFGVDARRYNGPLGFGPEGAGAFTYSSLQGFLLNLPPDVAGARTIGNLTFPTNQWDTYAYAKDDWKVRPNFDISLGVKYEYVTVPLAEQRQSLNTSANAGPLNFREPEPQTKNFAPMVGLAYSPGMDRNAVIRAGFSMNYDAATYIAMTPFLTPGLATTLYTTNLPAVPGFFGNGLTPGRFFGPAAGASLTTPQSLTTSYFPNQRIPYTIQWNASWEQTVFHRFVLTARYLGVHGVHYPAGTILNQGQAVTASNSLPLFYTRPTQAQLNALTPTLTSLQAQTAAANPLGSSGFTSPIVTTAPGGTSFYHGLAVEGKERFAGGFQMVAGYTWSHLIDNVSPFLSANPFFNLFQLTGHDTSVYDHRHRGTLTALWDVGAIGSSGPNWFRDVVANMNLSATYIYESPSPLTIQSGFDTGLGGFAGSGVFVNPNGIAGTGSGVTALTNSSGQVVGYLANNPNAQFVRGGLGTFAASPRNNFISGLRPINDFDASFVKRFAIRDHFALEFRADGFNVLNHPQFVPGNINTLGLGNSGVGAMNVLIPGSPIFGDVTQAFSSNPRMLQLALRLMF